jgi:hypothetical protein
MPREGSIDKILSTPEGATELSSYAIRDIGAKAQVGCRIIWPPNVAWSVARDIPGGASAIFSFVANLVGRERGAFLGAAAIFPASRKL